LRTVRELALESEPVLAGQRVVTGGSTIRYRHIVVR
jgi:hypothetical protein